MDAMFPLTASLAAATGCLLLGWLRRRQDEILEREVRFRSLIDGAADAFIIHDESGRIVDANRAAIAGLGYSRDELLRLFITDIETSLSSSAIAEICRRIAPGESVTLEGVHRRKDGTLFPVDVHLGNVETSKRKLFLALVRDVTSRKEAEARLLRANNSLTTLIQCNQALARITDEAALLQEICRIVVEIGGYDLAWVGAMAGAGNPVRVVAHAGEQDCYLQVMSLADPGLSPSLAAIESRDACIGAPGDDRFAASWKTAALATGYRAVIAIPLLHDRAIFGVLEICSRQQESFDVEEKRLLVELGEDLSYGITGLRDRLERLRIADELHLKSAALESAANAILITDRNGKIVWVNPAFTTLTGYLPEEVIDLHPRLFRAEGEQVKYADLWETILSGKVWRGEMLNRRKDGVIYHEEQTITPVVGDDGEARYFIAIKQDVTERKLAEAAVLENTRIRNEMEIAKQIQRSLLPEVFPHIPGVEVAARCVTASHVGGDYYDCFHVDGSKFLHLVIADVSGHSVGAALMMAEVRSTLRATRDCIKAPSDTLEVLNSLLYEDLDRAELFITMFVARVDLAQRVITFANAGHNRPVIYRPSTDSFIELDTDGLVLGVMRGIDFGDASVPLEAGDLVLLYTDGIVEATDETGEPFGQDRLYAAIRSAYLRSSSGIVEALFNQLSRFTGSTSWEDDISILAVKIE